MHPEREGMKHVRSANRKKEYGNISLNATKNPLALLQKKS